MGAIIIAFGIVGFFVLFAYLKFPPSFADKKTVAVFDKMVLGVCAFLCLMGYLNIDTAVGVSPDLRKPAAIALALGIEIIFLPICFILRNFFVFKPPRRPGGGGFF